MGRALPVGRPEQRDVEFHGPLIGEPQQGPAVVAERVRDLPLGCLGPHRDGLHPLRRVARQVLLHECWLAGPDADHGQRPVPQCWQDRIAHHVEVVDQMALCRTGTIEKLLVEVAQRHPVALVVRSAHRLIIAARVRTPRTAGGVAH